MGKKELVPNRRYTEEFKTEAVRLAPTPGVNATAKRLGIPQSSMTRSKLRHGLLDSEDHRCRNDPEILARHFVPVAGTAEKARGTWYFEGHFPRSVRSIAFEPNRTPTWIRAALSDDFPFRLAVSGTRL